jgi:enterochelin esterase-like enzyme
MSHPRIRIIYICRGALAALFVLSVVVACDRAEPPYLPVQITRTPTPAIAATSLPEEAAEEVSAPTMAAERPRVRHTPLPADERFPRRSTVEFRSDKVGDWYQVYVSLPQGYDPQHLHGYPVIYLLDADWYFDGSSRMIGDGGVAGIASSLSNGGRIPKAIVIGVGYVKKNQRGRDLLWAHEKFYAFLTEELIPFIDAEYRTDTTAPRTLVGHSDGAYLALYAFFHSGGNEDAPFRQFVAISGDLTKNEWLPFREEGKMNRRLGDGGVVRGALFQAVGAQDEPRFVTSTQDMAVRLEGRQYQEFRFRSKLYRSDDHMSVVTPAIWDGLLWVFDE